jgi:hypothetical protein
MRSTGARSKDPRQLQHRLLAPVRRRLDAWMRIVRALITAQLLVILSLPSIGSGQDTLTNGATHAGTISANQTDSWTFTASAGDNIWLRIGTSGFTPWLNLYGPDGMLIGAAFTNSTGNRDASLRVQATSDGTFTVVVSSYFFNGSGTYELMVSGITPPVSPTTGTLTATATPTPTDTSGTAWSITPAAVSVNERGGSVTFTVTRSNTTAAQTVYVSTTRTEGYENEGDYEGIDSQPLAFTVGVASQAVTVTISDDTEPEPNETFAFIVQQNATDPPAICLAKAAFTIVDDDARSQANLWIAAVEITQATQDRLAVNGIEEGSGHCATRTWSWRTRAGQPLVLDYETDLYSLPMNDGYPDLVNDRPDLCTEGFARSGESVIGAAATLFLGVPMSSPGSRSWR